MADKTFTLCFEGDEHTNKFEMEVTWNGDSPPNVITVNFGGTLVKVGRYASPGDRYWYQRADVARLDHDKLTPIVNTFTVNPRSAR